MSRSRSRKPSNNKESDTDFDPSIASNLLSKSYNGDHESTISVYDKESMENRKVEDVADEEEEVDDEDYDQDTNGSSVSIDV